MEASVEANNATPRKKSSWQLFAILAVTFIPLVAAYVAYYTGLGVPNDTVNNGALLEPAVDLKSIVNDMSGDKETLSLLENNPGKAWRILIPIPATCNEACRNNLYVTRQVHIRLGEKGERVKRYAVNIGGNAGQNFLTSIAEKYPKLASVTLDKNIWNKWLAQTNAPQNTSDAPFYLLIDQVGFAMMFYTADNHGNELLKDIKRVLRYSPDKN